MSPLYAISVCMRFVSLACLLYGSEVSCTPPNLLSIAWPAAPVIQPSSSTSQRRPTVLPRSRGGWAKGAKRPDSFLSSAASPSGSQMGPEYVPWVCRCVGSWQETGIFMVFVSFFLFPFPPTAVFFFEFWIKTYNVI